MFNDRNPKGYAYIYSKLAETEYSEDNYGGMYSNNRIYLRGKDKNIVFDIDAGTVSEIGELQKNKYRWTIHDNQEITIEDTEQNITRVITLVKMAENIFYAITLLSLHRAKGMITNL